MVIRPAEPHRDGAACAAIYAPYVRETSVSLEEEPPDGAEMARRIARISVTHPWLMAEEQGAVIGFAYGSRHRERASYRWAADVSVYVQPDHQRRGVGTCLYRELLERLRRQGFHAACAGITLPNPASQALHESLGFQLVGVYRDIGYKLGSWWDVGWWQLRLRAPGDAPPAEIAPPDRAG